MPIAHAMWIHGHSIRIEYPDRMDADTRRLGGYIRLVGRAGTSNWFHAAIPTAVIVLDKRLRIGRVMLRFRTSGATVTSVHVYDGGSRIASHDGLSLSPNDWAFEGFDIPAEPEIRWGLGLSFKGEFGSGTHRRIEVSSVGGDFTP
ncbi:DUF6623 family protein [Desulfococcus sp.]|uniref:DUF6623 family protein n=1 Tax=Desulfococcus sp. TaxID=2025834 RepID=UPI0035947048